LCGGGVVVIIFEMLFWFELYLFDLDDFGVVVVDEVYYIKNFIVKCF